VEQIAMSRFLNHVKNSLSYALSDRKAIAVIGTLIVVNSILRKDDFLHPVWSVFNVTIFFFVGYGSYISWYALKGEDKHPNLRSFPRIFWEGFKKSTIIAVYSVGLTFLSYHAKLAASQGNFLPAALIAAVYVLLYLCMVVGLLNRYLHRGKILEAFNIPEILRLALKFDFLSFVKVIIAVMISQGFAVLVVIGFGKGFTVAEIVFSVAAFFLAPFFYFATKRFIGLNVYDLLENFERK
jgi:hypothetical protein